MPHPPRWPLRTEVAGTTPFGEGAGAGHFDIEGRAISNIELRALQMRTEKEYGRSHLRQIAHELELSCSILASSRSNLALCDVDRVLICAITDNMTLAECDRISARDVLVVSGKFVSDAACFFGAQAYLATGAVGSFDRSHYAAKVVCTGGRLALAKSPS